MYGAKPNNMKALNSFCYNRLIHCKMVGVEPAAYGKGVVVGGGCRKAEIQPAKASLFLCVDHHQQERPGPPQQHPDPQEQVLPGPAHGRHQQSQRHPAQPEPVTMKRKQATPNKSS